jgi:hypothetical protein
MLPRPHSWSKTEYFVVETFQILIRWLIIYLDFWPEAANKPEHAPDVLLLSQPKNDN